MSILQGVNSPNDIKGLSTSELNTLCGEIREFLIESVSKTGGHLASNLGAVELTVALHRVFDVPKDKIVFDVGHQSYVHKILTGRKDLFPTLRQLDGLAGFPKRSESECDVFNTGHSSTSISAALGLARARELDGGDYSVIALFGDGALTGGMMYEAMNDAGHSKIPLILILNDNAMSISKNVGAVSKHLRNLRISRSYFKAKNFTENVLNRVPVLGKPTINVLRSIKRSVRGLFIPSTMFDDLGFSYIGPVDGHDLSALIATFEFAKLSNKPVFIHVQTKKGKGYAPAENDPSRFHGIGKFDPKTGESKSVEDYSAHFGHTLCDLAEHNRRIIAITGAMPNGTGLNIFAQKYKERFFDVGIAEQHGVTLSAGLAAGGYVPVIPLYSTFLQRAYDQVLHDVCLQNLHVVFPIDRAGVVGADGETHHGVFDIAYLAHMPNMTILSPSSFAELDEMLDYAVNHHNAPIAVRYPRGNAQSEHDRAPFVLGKAQSVQSGKDVCIVCSGRMVIRANEVQNVLKSSGISCEIIALPTIMPLDSAAVLAGAMKCGRMITIEDGVKTGGYGEIIAALLMEKRINCEFKIFAFPNETIPHGTVDQLDKKYGLDAMSIAAEVYKWLK